MQSTEMENRFVNPSSGMFSFSFCLYSFLTSARCQKKENIITLLVLLDSFSFRGFSVNVFTIRILTSYCFSNIIFIDLGQNQAGRQTAVCRLSAFFHLGSVDEFWFACTGCVLDHHHLDLWISDHLPAGPCSWWWSKFSWHVMAPLQWGETLFMVPRKKCLSEAVVLSSRFLTVKFLEWSDTRFFLSSSSPPCSWLSEGLRWFLPSSKWVSST